VIQVQVGQAGNRIGADFFRCISAEHGVDSEGKLSEVPAERSYGVHKYFQETSKQTFQPRCVLVDLEPSALDRIRGSAEGRLYSPDQYVFDQVGSGNLFPRGRYGEGAELAEVAMEAVRKQAEACDILQGFQFVHSIGGGTGSGLGISLQSKIREEYLDRMQCSYTVIPSASVSDNTVEAYNSIFCLYQLVENVNLTMMFDNEALYSLVQRKLEIERPTYGEINHQIATAMSGITCPFRFRGLLNSSYRKMAVNLVPYPRFHFLTVSEAPLSGRHSPAPVLTVPQIIDSVFDPCNYMLQGNAAEYRAATGFAAFRGDISSFEVENCFTAAAPRTNFTEWFSDPVSTSLCAVPALNRPLSATLLLNHGVVVDSFRRMNKQFRALYQRRAFLHHYLAAGMEEMEFLEVQSNADDLVCEYLQGSFSVTCYCCAAEPDDYEEA